MSVNVGAAVTNVHFFPAPGIAGGMNGWIVFAAVASTTITALLTWWLYRINAASLCGGDSDEGGAVDGSRGRGDET